MFFSYWFSSVYFRFNQQKQVKFSARRRRRQSCSHNSPEIIKFLNTEKLEERLLLTAELIDYQVDTVVVTDSPVASTPSLSPDQEASTLVANGKNDTTSRIEMGTYEAESVQGRVDLTVNWKATTVGASGNVSSLPANADFIDEWNPVVVEIWVSVTNSSENGVTAASVDFNFDAQYLLVNTIEYGAGFTENQTGNIDNEAGTITGLGAATSQTDHGTETLVLLARVRLSVKAIPLNANGHYIKPVGNLNFQISNSTLTSHLDDVSVTEGAATNLTLVPAIFDLNDSGTIDYRDLIQLVSAFNKRTIESNPGDYIWAADFDRSGRVDYRDLILFVTNYQNVKGSGVFFNYPSNFDEVWQVDTLLSVSDLVVDEDSQTVTLTVTSNQKVGSPFSISYSTVDGTAFSGVDFAATSGVLEFSGNTAGESQVITVQLIDDTMLELTEWFQITLENLTTEENIAFTQKQATIQIQNDDAIVIDEDSGKQIVELNGILTFNENSQVESVTVTSGDTSLIADPQIEYTPGSLTTTLTFSPEPDANGFTIFEIVVLDDQGSQTTHFIPVTVNPVNDVPVAVNDFFSIDENSLINSGNVFASNPDLPDQDRDGLGFLVTAVSGGVVGTWFTLDSGARLKINSDGTFSYDPDQQFEFLAEDEAANDSFTYTIADEAGATDTATVQISVNGVNDAPQVSGPISVTYSEDDPVDNIDLLLHTSDADVSDVLSINNVDWTGDAGGVSIDGTTLTIDPGYYNSLADGESTSITGVYQVVDPQGAIVLQTISLQVDGVNDAPQVSGPISVIYSEDDPVGSIDLLLHASDADTSDVLEINNLVWTGDAGGISLNGNTLTINPSYYNSLADGEMASITGMYQVVDPQGAIVSQSISLQVDGMNDAPQVSSPISVTYSEDDPVGSIDLLLHASDADTSDVLEINNLVWTGDAGGISINGTTLTINPSYYNSLADGEMASITGVYQVVDSQGAIVSQSISLQVDGMNDAPQVSSPISVTYSEDDPVGSIDLLLHASDADTSDVLEINNLVWSGSSGGMTVNGSTLMVDPSHYEYLAQDMTEVVTASYQVIDAHGGAVSQTVSITINGTTNPEDVFNQIVVTDQVLDYHDGISFSLSGAGTFLGSVTATSSNQDVISDVDISLTRDGGDLRVGITHQSGDYGLSVIRLFSDGEVVHEFSVLVLPPETVTQQQAGSLNLGFDFEDIPVEGSGDNDEIDSTTIINVSYNDRALAYLVAHGHVSTADAMRLANPVRRRSFYEPSESESVSLETSHSSAGDTGAGRVTTQRQTYYGGITEQAEPDTFDKIDNTLKSVAYITDVLDEAGKSNMLKAINLYGKRSVGEIVTIVFLAADQIIDAIDQDNTIDLSASGELLGGVTDLTWDMTEFFIAVAVTKNPKDIAFSTIQFLSSTVSLTNTVRHMIDDSKTSKVVETALETPNLLVEETIRQVAVLGEKTGINELMTKSSVTRDLGNNLKGYVSGTTESGDVLAAGAQTFQKVMVAKEYIDTTTQIAEHIEDIWNELFGPDDLYIDKDGVSRSWSADQTRTPTSGKDNVTTGSGNDTVRTGQGNDKVETNAGDDYVDGGGGDNRVDTGSGNDIVKDGEGDSFISTGKGADYVEDLGGNDRIDLGKGIDELVYPTRNIGRDLLFDSGRSGTIRLQAVEHNEISLMKQGDDLTISIANTGDLLNDQIRIVDFFRNQETDWTVYTQDGAPIDLRRETGQLRLEQAAELALRTYSDISTYGNNLPANLLHYKTIKTPITGLHAEVFIDQSEAGQTPSQIYVSVQGTHFLDMRDLAADLTAGRFQASALINALEADFTPAQLKSITIVGHSLGGMVAQWVGAFYAAHDVSFVNVVTLNSPELSGLIGAVIRDQSPGASPGFENLASTHIVDLKDYVSRVGWWSSNGLGTSTWVTWEHPENRPGGISLIGGILKAHTPLITDFTEGEVEFTILTPEMVQEHLVFESVEDTTHSLIRVNEFSSATLSFFQILFPDQTLDFGEIQTQNQAWDSDFVERLSPESLTVPSYSRKFDFGTVQSNLAQGYDRVTDQTLFVSGDGLYGWEQITDDLNAVDRGRATSANRDFVATQGNTFIVDLSGSEIDLSQPRTYNISFTTGDRDQLRESMVYYVNGFHYDTLATMPGQFLTHGMQLTTSDSKLTITIKDRGGNTEKAIINSLTIELVAYGSPAPETTVVREDTSVVVLTHGYTIPGGVAAVTEVIKETVKETIAAAKDVYAVVSAFKKGGKVLAVLKATEITLRRVKEALQEDDDSVRANSRVHDWVFEAADSFAQMSQRFRLGKLDANVIPVEFDKVLDAINAGKTGEELLKFWKGSHDFLALDWTDESSDGAGIFQINDFDEIAHRNAVETGAFIYHKLLQAWIDKLQKTDPELQLDLLLVSHSYGYNVNRKLAERLSYHKIADDIDYLKVVALDPVSMKPDELVGAQRESDRLNWYHPELTPEVDAVTNYYQTEGVFHTKFTSVALAGGAIGPAIHELAGRIEEQIVFGQPLDGREGGGTAGFYNRQARIFDLESLDEILRFRHWDPNEVELSSAELTDIEFSRDGSLVAASGKDGIVTVRYVDDVPAEAWDQPGNPPVAGDVKFIVWGQEAIVRSLAFVEMEVDGEWKEFLLTISAAHNPENSDIDKNKILLTDMETGLPVWQGRDIQGTQVEASPSGKTIVSTDANGNAKIWIRDEESLTFEKHGEIVKAHPGDGGSYITDVYVINDKYFVTAGGPTKKVKLFEITDDGAKQVDVVPFDNPEEGRVYNLDYDPYNGVLAVAAGQQLSLWKLDRELGKLVTLSAEASSSHEKFIIGDHVDSIQGVAFSKPSFLLDDQGNYHGDRVIILDNQQYAVPRTPQGDIDIEQLSTLLAAHGKNSLTGLQLVTGGEDRTVFRYSLDRLDIGSVLEETVLSGAMLPIREIAISPDGSRVAIVGQDNTDSDYGGPVKDIDVTSIIDKRLGFSLSELFIGGLREHNEVPKYYLDEVLGTEGESYFWQRNNEAASRPGDLPKDRNLSLPPNKRDNKPDVDVAPIELYVRPGQEVVVKPLQYLLEVDRTDYTSTTVIDGRAIVYDADDNAVGEIRNKKENGKTFPNIFIFEAYDDVDGLIYSDPARREYIGLFTWKYTGLFDAEGDQKTGSAVIQFRIINHQPITYTDVIDLHPGRSVTDFRPRQNDYDFDNDDFALIPFPAQKQSLIYVLESGQQYELGTVQRTPGNEAGSGIDINVTISQDELEELLELVGEESVTVEISYQVQEKKYKAISEGTIHVRFQLQKGPTEVYASELGADQVRINWKPVSWNADKYVIQHYDTTNMEWVKNAEVQGKNSNSKLIAIDPHVDQYWFRVVAVNEYRREESFEGEGPGGLSVEPPEYTSPQHIVMEVQGSGKVEVAWDKVFWNAGKYEIDLYEILENEAGELITVPGDQQYEFNPEFSRHKETGAGEPATVVFNKLTPGRTYFAKVTAKRGDLEFGNFAEYPVTTSSKKIPGGIDIKSLGPNKVKVSWATVEYAEKYRVVAMSPMQPLDANRIFEVTDAGSGSAHSAVLNGLSPDTSYVIIVEAKDKKSGKWVSVASLDYPPVIISNEDAQGTQSPIEVDGVGTTEFILLQDFNGTLRLPSTAGLFVDTEFSIVNLSQHEITIESADGREILYKSGSSSSHTLYPANAARAIDAEDRDGGGIIIYRFITVSPGDDGDAIWKIETGDNPSEARLIHTPEFRAIEESSFDTDSVESLPKRPVILWNTPFWQVDRHKLQVFEVTLDSEGAPIQNADGSYQLGREFENQKVVKQVNSGSPVERSHQFEGLSAGTNYVVRITTYGETTVSEEFLMETPSQHSPKNVGYENVTLTSFTATWTEVTWNVQEYRVGVTELDANGDPVGTEPVYYNVNAGKSSKVIENLKTGVTYQFTVEARTADPDAEKEWIENTPENINTVTILSAADLSIKGFKLDAARIRQLDLSWDALDFEAEELSLELLLEGETDWTQAEKYSLGVNKENFTLEDLELNTDYQIRLVAKVKNSDGTTEPIISSEINGATIWGIDSLSEFSEIKVEVKFPRLAIASKYELNVYDASNGQLFATLDLNQKSSTTISYDLTGLKPGSKYDLELVAWDGMTKLTTSAKKSITMPAVEKPMGLMAEDKAKGKMKVTWEPLTWVPDHQYVQVWTGQTASWMNVPGSDVSQGVSTVLQDLEPGGVYQVKVVTVLDLADGTQYKLESDPIPYTLRAYPAPDFGPVLTEAFQNVRQYKVDVHWSFSGNLDDIEKFQIIRENGNYLGALEAADFAGQTSFHLEIERTANSSYFVFVRAKYRDGELVDSATLQLPKIDTVPEFSVSNETEDSADANWNQVQNAGVTKYRIVVYERGTENIVNSKEVSKGSGSQSRTIDGLAQGADYDMVVEALAGSDVIATSERKEFSTRTVPPVPNLIVDQVYPTSVRANWSQITGFTINEYRILIYFKDTTVEATSRTVDRDSGDRHITVSGLATGTEYDLVVQALKGTTVLSTSPVHSFTTSSYVSPEFGTPTKDPFTDVRQKKVIVNWSFNGNPDNIDTFQIVRENGTVLGTLNPASFPNQSTFEKEIDRSANSGYYVFIRANYKDGTKLTSSTLQLPKIDTVPGFTVNHVTQDSADANWDQVLNAGVTEYRIVVYARGTETLIAEKVVNKGTGSRTSTIDGLAQGTNYDMVLEALSGSEVIASSDRIQFTTLVVPAVPNMFVDQVYPKSVQANWGQVTGFPVSDYQILIYHKGTSSLVTSKKVSKGSGDRRSTVDGLSENTQYEMVIQALNGSTVLSSSSRVAFTTSSYVAPDFGPTAAQAFTDVRKQKVVVNWSFSGIMGNVDTFQIVRENGTVLGTLNPASFPNQTSFAKEIDRTSNSKYNLFIRVNYKDGTKLTSITLQLPEA